MDELQQQRKQLGELRKLVNSLNICKDDLPPGVVLTDLDYFMREIDYLRGYLECMINFQIEFSDAGAVERT